MESATTTTTRKYPKLGTRLSLSFAILATVSVIITGAVLYLNFRSQIREDLRQRLLNVISIAALQQDGDLHATLTKPEDKQSEAYRILSARNVAILKTDPELVYFFTARQDENGNIYFVLDNSADPAYQSLDIGDIYADPSELLKTNFATLDRPIVEQEIYTDVYGTFLSAYAPFYRSDGTREGIIGVDMNASTVLAREQQFLTLTIISILVSIPFVALFGWILGNRLAAPISRLAITAKKVAAGDFNLRADINPNSQEVFELQTDFNLMTDRLQGLISNLEQRVAERTADLEERNQELEAAQQQIERRVGEVLLIATISRTITSIQNLDVLLPEITRLISISFGYYHVGIFLNDEKNQYTVLRATNSVGGQRMLARQHKLEIGRTGIVGNVAQTGKARIALDTGKDAVFFENPELPETRSEIALPLQVGERIIGVLDVQSTQPNAFEDADIETLSILADQIATAIQTALLFEETRRALRETERVSRSYIQQAWRSQMGYQETSGFVFDAQGIHPLGVAQDTKAAAAPKNLGVSVPIKVRDVVVGYLNVHPENDQELDPDEQDIIAATAERVALAIENARLIAESQRRAAKEQTIGEISAKLGASINIDNVLRTALLELGQIIPGSEIFVEFERDTNE